MNKKQNIRTALISMILFMLTASAAFGTAVGFFPYHGSQPIIGVGKTDYLYNKGNITKVQKGAIVPTRGISEEYTEQARSTSTSTFIKVKGAPNSTGATAFASGNTLKASYVLNPNDWLVYFVGDKTSSNDITVKYTNNIIYDPNNPNADENGYVHLTVKATVIDWDRQPTITIGKNYKQTSFTDVATKNKYTGKYSFIALSKKTYSGIPRVTLGGIGNANIVYDYYIEKKNSAGKWVETSTNYTYKGTFTMGDINMKQAISVAYGNIDQQGAGATVTEDTTLRFKKNEVFYSYVGSPGHVADLKDMHKETVALSIGGSRLNFVYSSASALKNSSGTYYPSGHWSYFYTVSKSVTEPAVQNPLKRVSDNTKHKNAEETKVTKNNLLDIHEPFTYTVTQHIPAGIDPKSGSSTEKFKYSMLKFKDTLKPELEIVQQPKFTIGSTDITSWFTNNSLGNSLNYAMTNTGLSNPVTYGNGAGSDIVMTVKVRVKSQYDFQALVQAGYQVGSTCVIPNKASTAVKRSVTDAKKTESAVTRETNTVETVIPYTEVNSHDLKIQKVNTGGETTDSFAYSIAFTGLKAGRTYSYTEAGVSKTLTASSSGTANVTFSLKGGENTLFSSIPAGAKYKITETGKERYTPSYTVTEGSASVSKINATGEMSESLSTPQETLSSGTENVTFTFVNTYTPPPVVPDPNEITVTKKVTGESTSNPFNFELRFYKSGASSSVSFKKGSETVTASGQGDGYYYYRFTLSNGESVRFTDIPNDIDSISVVETTEGYVKNCEVTAGSRYAEGDISYVGDSLESQKFTIPAQGGLNAKLLFTNSKDTANKTRVSKRVVGENDSFDFTTNITGLTPGENYVMLQPSNDVSYSLDMTENGSLKIKSARGIVKGIPVTITRPDGEKKTFTTNKNGEVEDYIEWLSEGREGSSFEFSVEWLGQTAKYRYGIPETEAYAEFDSSTKVLRIFRDDKGKYTNEQTEGTKTYYAGIEDIAGRTNPKWRNKSSSITKVVIEDPFAPQTAYRMFNDCRNLTEIQGIKNLDTSNVTDMSEMFSYCNDLTTLDVSHFDTSNVTDMRYMFYRCSSLPMLDLSNFDTSNVTDMSYMFEGCSSLSTLDLSHFDTSNVIDMDSMFEGCSSLSTLDLSHFDTSNVTDMGRMFSDCSSLTTLDVSHFDTSNVTDMSSMFAYCNNITTLDVSHFDTSKVTDMSDMFYGCSSLTMLDLSNFDTSIVWSMTNMLFDCSNIRTIYASFLWNTSGIYYSSQMFTGCSNLPNYDSNVTDKTNAHFNERGYLTRKDTVAGSEAYAEFDSSTGVLRIFRDEPNKYGDEEIDGKTYFAGIESLTKDWTGASSWGGYNESVTKVIIESTFKPKNVEGLFNRFNNLAEIQGMENLDTSDATNMSYMFWECYGLTTLDLSSFDTSNVTNMSHMFSDCMNLTTLDLSSFNTSNVTDMSDMFYRCSSLPMLDLSNFNTSNVTNMEGMFDYCDSVETIYVSESWDTSKVVNHGSGMFYECYSLDNFSSTATDVTYAHCNEGGYLTMKHDESVSDETEAYAEYDSNSGILRIFRDEPDKYYNEQTEGTKTYYAGIEDITGESYPKWYGEGSYITKVVIEDTFAPQTAVNMFEGCYNLTEIQGMENLDTSNVTDMSHMFAGCNSLTTLDVSHFDTSNVTDMDGMFSDCSSLTMLDLSHFDTSNVTSMNSMFAYCSNITTLNLSHFDTSRVTDMSYMFYDCRKLNTSLNIMNMPSYYTAMCSASYSTQIVLRHINPVTSKDIEKLAETNQYGHAINGGEGTYTSYDPSGVYNIDNPSPAAGGVLANQLSNNIASYRFILGDIQADNVEITLFPADEDGNASIDYSLKDGEYVDFVGLDENAKLKTTEHKSKYTPAYTVSTQETPVTGRAKRDLTTGATSVGEDVQFTNTAPTLMEGRVSITKNTAGNLASDNDEFTFTIDIGNLTAGQDYYLPTEEEGSSLELEITDAGAGKIQLFDSSTGDGIPEKTITIYQGEQTREVATDKDGAFYVTLDDTKFTWEGGEVTLNWSDTTNDRWQNYEDLEGNPIENGTILESLLDYDPSKPGWYQRGILESITGDTEKKVGTKITADPNGSAQITITLKNGESFILSDLPKGATYKITETGGRGYTPAYEVIAGADLVSQPAGAAEVNQNLSTATETVPGSESVAYLFTNEKSQAQNLKVKKVVTGDASNQLDEFDFRINIDGAAPNTGYTDSNGDTVMSDSQGSISKSITLKHNETYEILSLPGNTYFNVTEEASNYKPSANVTFQGESEPVLNAFGGYREDLSIDGNLEKDAIVTFTNLREELHYLEIEKKVEGDLSDTNDQFTFNVQFSGLKPSTRHTVYSYDGFDEENNIEVATFTTDSAGNANPSFQMKAGEVFHITGLKDGATYRITESANRYIPFYEATLGSDAVSQKEGEGQKNQSLSTAQETLTVDTGYIFRNKADLNSPTKTVSDTDNITWEGTGQEVEVTLNTVKNLSSTWTYKIRQDIPDGVTDVTITDTFPEQLTPSNIKVYVGGADKTSEWTINSEDNELVAYNENFTGSDVTLSFDVSVRQNMTQPMSGDGTYYVYENSASTILDGMVRDTNKTETRVPLSGGIVIKKNVKGSLGDRTKAFEFVAHISGLRANESYSLVNMIEKHINVSLEDDIKILVSDKSGETQREYKLIITDPSGKEKAYVTGNDGIATVPASDGVYSIENGDSVILFSLYNGTLSGDTSAVLSAGEGEKPFKADASGSANIDFTLCDDENLVIPSLPEGATYRITEKASDHVASFDITSTEDNPVIAKASGQNSEKETALSTSTERLDSSDGSITVTYTNKRDMATQTGAYSFLKYWWVMIIMLTAASLFFVWRKYRLKTLTDSGMSAAKTKTC